MRIKGIKGPSEFYSDSGYFLDGSLIYLRCVDRFGEYVNRLVDAIYRSTGIEIFEGDIVMARLSFIRGALWLSLTNIILCRA